MTDGWTLPALDTCEELVDGDELYLRQVHPDFWDGFEVSVFAFTTSSNDDGKLSGARSGKQTAEGAYRERLQMGGLTAGTWAVTVTEVTRESSRVVDDTRCPPPPGEEGWPQGHCYLDQRMPDKPHRRKLRANLARAATLRKRLFPSPE